MYLVRLKLFVICGQRILSVGNFCLLDSNCIAVFVSYETDRDLGIMGS